MRLIQRIKSTILKRYIMQVQITKFSKGIDSVLGQLTHPTKKDTASHYKYSFYINTSNLIGWKVFKADVPDHIQSEVFNYIKYYQQTH